MVIPALVFDVEASGAQRNKGNPFDPRNVLCCISSNFSKVLDIQHGEEPYADNLKLFQRLLNETSVLVGFNLKYDIHWIRRYNLILPNNITVWDCQLFHFIRSNRRHKFPSLDDVAEFYGLPHKLDIVKTEYWEKGLDTTDVPWEILEEYAQYDVNLTEKIYNLQLEEYNTLPQNKKKLIRLSMADLLTIEQMEFNGMLYDAQKSERMGHEISKEIEHIDSYLGKFVPNLTLNFGSDQQLSAFLYGGNVKQTVSEEYTFHYKDGRQAQKIRRVEKTHTLPRIVEPLRGTEMKKEGIFSVDADNLRKIMFKSKGIAKKIIELLLHRSKIEKRRDTYCFGTVKLINVMGWNDNILHQNLSQTTAITGRLACSKPNLQNQDHPMEVCFPSRFKMRNK